MSRPSTRNGIPGTVCSGCATCCIEPVVPVTDADVRRLGRATGLPAGRITALYSSTDFEYEPDHPGWVRLGYGRRVLGLRRRGGRCMFLGADRRCTVYPARPMTCRTFPFGIWFDRRGRVAGVEFLDAVDCRRRAGTIDRARLREDARCEDAEDAVYHRRVAQWNRCGAPGGKREFLRFLGLQ